MAVVAATAVGAMAHGFISVPVARNVNSGTYCDQCLNAGGPGAVYGNGQWPNGRHGVCGDPASGDGAGYHEGGGKFEQTVGIRITYFHAGDTIRVKGRLTANHLGYMSYFLCALPPNSMGGAGEKAVLTDQCFNRNPLRVQQDGTWGTRFYVSGKLGEFENVVKLPDFECPRCVLRWYYITGNSCTPPGTPAKWASPNLGVCGTGIANPEEFWNCADITLLKKGSPLPAQSSKKLKGEVASGVASNTSGGAAAGPTGGGSGPEPGEQSIDTTASDDPTASSANDTSIVSFEDVFLSVAVGAGMGIPVVLFSPAIGIGTGLCGFMLALMFFIITNATDKEGFKAR